MVGSFGGEVMTRFSEIKDELRRPFTPAAVRFKVQATWPKGQPTGGQVVAYVDARLVSDRLNAVCPDDWQSDIVEGAGGAICRLTICGQTRTDFGKVEFVDAKGSFSDSFKRAAVHFGIAASLYQLPRMVLNVGNGLDLRGPKNSVVLTPQGVNNCRRTYTDWLNTVGIAEFGEPFDHGDKIDHGEQTPNEVLADLIAQADFNTDQIDSIRAWAKNGNGLDAAKVQKATNLLLADEPEVLLERAGA